MGLALIIRFVAIAYSMRHLLRLREIAICLSNLSKKQIQLDYYLMKYK